jgi:cell division protein FtsB
MFATLLLLVVLAFLARWVASGWGGGHGNPELQARHTAEIARLRDEVDQLQAQVLRLGDEQSFLMRLLTEGDRPRGELPGGGAAPDHPNPESH